MPQRSGYNGSTGNSALDPTVLERANFEEVFACRWPGEKGRQAAADALVEITPRNLEIGLSVTRKTGPT